MKSLLPLVVLGFAFPVLAQSASGVSERMGWLRVDSNAPDALVMVDSVVVGRVADAPFEVGAGLRSVRITEDALEAWDRREASGSVTVPQDEEVALRLDLPYEYRIETLPIGAAVALDGASGSEDLGTAPLVLRRDAPLRGTLVATRVGFLPARLAPGDSLTNRQTLMLRPLEAASHEEHALAVRAPREPNVWIDVAAAGLALASAGVAIYYKFEADAIDDRYRLASSPERGDPALKAEAERLDVYSLAALGAMQVGIGILGVRLVLR